MATTFKLECTASGKVTGIRVVDNLIFQDTWEAEVPSDWDVAGGEAKSLGQPETYLSNGTGTPHVLMGFSTAMGIGDTGSGTKNALAGDFPPGDFDWVILEKA